MQQSDDFHSYSLAFVEKLYDQYLIDPSQVPEAWRRYFEGLPPPPGKKTRPTLTPTSIFNPAPAGQEQLAPAKGTVGARDSEIPVHQQRVDDLIRGYRERGHLVARIDPLNAPRPRPTELELSHYGFTDADLDKPFSTESFQDAPVLTLAKIIERLERIYCGSVGIEYQHVGEAKVREWLRDRLENPEHHYEFSAGQQRRLLERLTAAVVFEDFLQRKFTGAKSFSLEGADTKIPMLDQVVELAGEQGIERVMMGMAHRGRLNVLANILRKPAREVFQDFLHIQETRRAAPRDVPYHMGYTTEWKTPSGRGVQLSLCYNSSHLEFRAPVTLGRTRAQQDQLGDAQRRRAMTVLIHGEAAIIGEGIVQETFNLSQLQAYTVGGTLHIVINNQLGFTTTPGEGRSSTYATDIAKMLQIPIFHVNAADPEAALRVITLAMHFRLTFQRDVVVELCCYRRRGHNEGDEPSFTQPLLYRAIERRKLIRDEYLDTLLQAGRVTQDQADDMALACKKVLEDELAASKHKDQPLPTDEFNAIYGGMHTHTRDAELKDVPTGVEAQLLTQTFDQQLKLPEGFRLHPKLAKWLEQRREMAHGQRPLDWAAAEALAFATLANSGVRIRFTGQDSIRGTFSQRHAAYYDYHSGKPYMPLQHLSDAQAPVEICNSPLSEAAVMGFEYGYSLESPRALVLWEAQFGDFVNAAQVIIDQFIVSGQHKWGNESGLTLLLPHGLEGVGPEHSSARVERFLALAADDNIQVVYPSTPAQYFHVLRRQMLRSWRRPLIVLTPKSLLRHSDCVSPLEDLERGTFRRVLPDTQVAPDQVQRVLLCSGKIYYELAAHRAALQAHNVAIVRLEQLYPLSLAELQVALAPYRLGTHLIWVQEEPANMFAWRFLHETLGDHVFNRFPLCAVFRQASPSPASGSLSYHKLEQKQLLAEAFEGVVATTPESLETATTETISHDNST